MNVYDFSAKSIEGKEVMLSDYRGKVLLIVNTASKCGFTPQYKDLQALYEKYAEQGFEILGFPSNQFAEQEPDSNEQVKTFCQLNFGVTFSLFAKGDVRGETAQPLFKFLTSQVPFRGFDANHPIAAKLQSVLEEKFPEILEGDSIKWNFTKFLIDRNGNVVERFEPTTLPADMEKDIQNLLLL